jgi:hypothetical protein
VRIHPGVSLVLKHLREKLGISHDFSLKTLAGISGLSQSRFMHVFTQLSLPQNSSGKSFGV